MIYRASWPSRLSVPGLRAHAHREEIFQQQLLKETFKESPFLSVLHRDVLALGQLLRNTAVDFYGSSVVPSQLVKSLVPSDRLTPSQCIMRR